MGRRLTNLSSRRVEAFKIPILLELAKTPGGLSSHHWRDEPSRDLEALRQNLYSYFDLSYEQRSVRLQSGSQPQVYQEIHRARHKLVADGLVSKDRWQITEHGLLTIRIHVHWVLNIDSISDPAWLENICSAPVSGGTEFFMYLASQLNGEQLEAVAAASRTRRDFFLACIAQISPRVVTPVLLESQAVIENAVRSNLRRTYTHDFEYLASRRDDSVGVHAYG